MAAFPDSISCILVDGYKEVFPVTKRYLGGKSNTTYATAKVTAGISSHADMATFTTWYVTTINNGLDAFTLDVPFFGTRKNWNVKFAKPINTKLVGKAAHVRDISMDLVILDTIT